MRLNIFTTKLW